MTRSASRATCLAGCLAVLCLGALASCGKGDTESVSPPALHTFTEVELRSDRPGLEVVFVNGTVHQGYCQWEIALRNTSADSFEGAFAITVAYRGGGKERQVRFNAALDLEPHHGARLSSMTRPGVSLDGVDWVHLRYLGPLSRAVGTPPVID